MDAVFARMRAVGAAANSAGELRRAMGAFGLESDPLHEPVVAEQRRAMVAARLPHAYLRAASCRTGAPAMPS